MKFIASIALTLILAASGGGSSLTGEGLQADNNARGFVKGQFSECQTSRSQACTREYAPVCGKLNNRKLHTFANACTACADQAVEGFYPSPCVTANMQACQDPRPEVCTMDYRPVCGQLGGGETKTYGNACAACGNSSVIGFFEGECN